VLWAKEYGGTGHETLNGMALQVQGGAREPVESLYLTGSFTSAAATFGTDSAFQPYTEVLAAANGTADTFVIKVRLFRFQLQQCGEKQQRRHPTDRERMGSPTLQTRQDPTLLRPWVCSRGGGFPVEGSRAAPHRPQEDGLAHPADTSRSNLAAALGLLSRPPKPLPVYPPPR
jgi:hypothetical protein